MHSKSDAQLLRDYAEHRDEAAFREIVVRYADLVYSAALRQVESPDLAADIAQSAFTDLARKAGSLGERLTVDSSLAGWLHRATRYAALNHLRDRQRRSTNERQAMTQLLANAEPSADWEQIQPVLDEALESLDDEDREAVLLRYFKNEDLRSVGRALDVSDDAAQKRVSRAVDRLREFFSKRQLTIGASGLVVLISANAVQSAPVGLAAAISTAVLAGTAVTTSTAIATTKMIAMTTLQKTIVAATVAVLAGAGVYEAKQARDARVEIQTLQEQQAPLAEQLRQMQSNFADATNRLAGLVAENARLKSDANENELLKLRGEVTQLQNQANDPTEMVARDLAAKINKLKQLLEETPSAKIPELHFLTEKDWINAANGRLDNDAAYRRALSTLRNAAEGKFAAMLNRAVIGYMKNTGGQMPTDLAQLQPYFDSPIDEAILQRWEIVPINTVPSLRMGGNTVITQKAPVDDIFDTQYGIGPNGFGSTEFLTSETENILTPVYYAYSAANNGERWTNLSQLLPYATTPEQQAAVQKLILRDSLIKQVY